MPVVRILDNGDGPEPADSLTRAFPQFRIRRPSDKTRSTDCGKTRVRTWIKPDDAPSQKIVSKTPLAWGTNGESSTPKTIATTLAEEGKTMTEATKTNSAIQEAVAEAMAEATAKFTATISAVTEKYDTLLNTLTSANETLKAEATAEATAKANAPEVQVRKPWVSALITGVKVLGGAAALTFTYRAGRYSGRNQGMKHANDLMDQAAKEAATAIDNAMATPVSVK